MAEVRVSMTELRQQLGSLINRAAYGGDRILLVSHGQPRAAIIGIGDLERLRDEQAERVGQGDRYAEALGAVDLLRERIRLWQEAHGVEPEDSAEALRRLREERDDKLSGVR